MVKKVVPAIASSNRATGQKKSRANEPPVVRPRDRVSFCRLAEEPGGSNRVGAEACSREGQGQGSVWPAPTCTRTNANDTQFAIVWIESYVLPRPRAGWGQSGT